MYFNFTAYIYIYILLFSHEGILQQYKEQYIFFLPDLVLHLFTFLCSPIKKKSLIVDFIKLCTPDFSKVTFATELSTNLVHKSIFVIDYNHISIHLLFFFTVKLSIFSRLCVKHKRMINTY